jgi:hypothetical protein
MACPRPFFLEENLLASFPSFLKISSRQWKMSTFYFLYLFSDSGCGEWLTLPISRPLLSLDLIIVMPFLRRIQSSLRSEDDKKKKRRSSYMPKPAAVPVVDKDEHIRQLEKRLADLMLKNREVKTLRSELSEQRRKYKELEEQYHQNRLMWLIATGSIFVSIEVRTFEVIFFFLGVNPGENVKVLQASSACAAAARGDVKTLQIMLEHDADIHQCTIEPCQVLTLSR